LINFAGKMSLASSRVVKDEAIRSWVPKILMNSALLVFLAASFMVPKSFASEEFFVPFPEDDTLSFLEGISSDASCGPGDSFGAPDPAEPVNTVTDFVVRIDNSIIVIDHWEDGYENDLEAIASGAAPISATTRVYGDGNVANGAAPGVITNAGDVLTQGQVVVFEESINTGTQLSDIEVTGQAITGGGTRTQDGLDGGDRIFASETINVTRAQWAGSSPAQSGTLFAGAFELFPTSQWGESFTLPVGEDSNVAEFEWAGVTIMAANDGTSVSVDANADGDFTDPDDVNAQVIDRGETIEILGRNDSGGQTTGSMNQGARIFSSDIVQVNVISGVECSNYASRWFTLFPDALLGSTYYEPVSTRAQDATVIYLYNPSLSAITINWETNAGLQTPIVVAANSTVAQQMPADSGARFFTGTLSTFGALTIVDRAGTRTDWGHASTSRRLMGDIVQVGYAEGDDPSRDDLYPANGGIGENGAPVWIIADNPNDPADTQYEICVDVRGDGGVNTDPNSGRTYDYTFTLDRLDSARLYDGGRDTPNNVPAHIDGDQSGMLAFVCDGSDTILAAAWGQAPNAASGAVPAVDVGTTVRSISAGVAFLGDTVYEDENGNGVRDPGERGIENVTVILTPPANVNLGFGPGQPLITATDFNGAYLFTNLVNGDYTVEVLAPSDFTQTADPDADNGDPVALDNTSTPTITDGSGRLDQDFGYTNSVPIGQVGDFIYTDANGNGIQDLDELGLGIGGINVELCQDGPPPTVQIIAQDTFLPAAYNNNSTLWSGDWIELGDDAAPATAINDGGPFGGFDGIRYFAGRPGELLFRGNSTTPDGPSVTRQFDATGFTNVVISVDASADGLGTYEADDVMFVQVSINNAAFTTIGTIEADQIDGFTNNFTFPFASTGAANVRVRFQINQDNVFSPAAADQEIMQLGQVVISGLTAPVPPVCQTTTTAADGSYLFTGLTPGNYTVTVLNPPIGASNSDDPGGDADNTNQFSLFSSGGNLEQDFGYFTPALVIGHVYLDTNGNGVQDLGEPNIPNLDVEVTDSLGNLSVVTTDLNGDYLASVPPGTTQVNIDESDPDYPIGFIQTDGVDPTVVTAIAGATVDAGDDGYFQGNVIGDTVYSEEDGNPGAQGAGDPGIANVLVTLTPPAGVDIGAGAGNPISTFTNTNGNYSFVGLPDATYTVTVAQPGGAGGSTQTQDPDGGNDNSSVVSVAGGVPNNEQDFGYDNSVPQGLIGDRVYNDSNGNGVQDGAETGIAGIVVQLCGDLDDNNATPNTCRTETTDANGDYLFGDSLTADGGIADPADAPIPATDGAEVYTVTITNPPAGQINSQDPDLGLPNFSQLTLSTVGGNLDQDFGYFQPGTVTGHLYIDSNGDGVQQATEPDLVGVDVVITDANGFQQVVTTNGDGDYLAQVPPGTTTANVDETDPQFPLNHIQTQGTDPSTVTAVAGASVSAGIDGYAPAGSIGDLVFFDSAASGTTGVFDSGIDTGVPNAVVSLTPPAGIDLGNGAGNAISTLTDLNGNYSFGRLPAGTYIVEVTQPSNTNATVDPNEVGACVVCDNVSVVTITTGETNNAQDFGYQSVVAAGQIGDKVFTDINGNGVFDIGEPGIAGVIVELCGDLDNNDATPATCRTEITGPDGDYLFGDELVGGGGAADPADTAIPATNGTEDYTVTITNPPAGQTNTADPDNGSENVAQLTLPSGISNLDQDFGYTTFGSISGTVSEDTNGDGAADAGLPNVIVQLYTDPNGDGDPSDGVLVEQTLTDASGAYLFSDVGSQNVDYVVVEIDPADYSSVTDSQSSDGDVAANVGTDFNAIPVTLSPGENDANNNFIDAQTAAIAGTVWLDEDLDGTNDIEETRLTGIIVELRDAGGILIATTSTDAFGNYQFDGLGIGDFTVTVVSSSLPAGLATTLGDGGINPKSVTTTANATLTDVDFGFIPNPGTGAIGDRVWSDANGNGLQDGGEAGIAGVTLELLDAAGSVVATTTSGSDGDYLFTNVAFADDYTVSISETDAALIAFSPTLLPTQGPQSEGAYIGNPVSLSTALAVVSDIDFGFNANNLNAINDEIWFDENGDGVRDANEAPISGVVVNLYADADNDGFADDLDGDGQADVVATQISDQNGVIGFAGLADGRYLLGLNDTNLVLSGLNATTDEALAGFSDPVVLTGGVINSDTSFGFNNPGLIAGTVYADGSADSSADADQSSSEAGIGGVSVTLLLDADNDGSFETTVSTLATDSSGNYVFDGLPAGDYQVVVSAPGGTQTEDPDTLINSITDISLAVAQSSVENDFGYTDVANLFDLSGNVFLDSDKDGVDDLGEGGIEGVTLVVIDSNTGEILATTTTDVSGDYSFTGLPNGDYQIAVSDDLGNLTGYDLTSGLDTQTRTINNADQSDIDFGYIRQEATGSIAGELWIDEDGDGLPDDNEAQLSNVDVFLCSAPVTGVCNPLNPNFVVTTTTDANGDYLFTGLIPGEYEVEADPSDIPVGLDMTVDPAPVKLSEGEDVLSVNIGYEPATNTGLLSGFIWVDVNNNGLADAGEAPIGGVTVEVFDSSTATVANPQGNVIFTTTSAPDGSWIVPNITGADLTDGLLVGYVNSTVDAGAGVDLNDGQPTNLPLGDFNYFPVELASDPDNAITFLDFGFNPEISTDLGSISGIIYSDADQDGDYLASSDGELQGVTLNLLDGVGNVVATTTTDDNGAYQFTGLVSDTYTVVVTDNNNVTRDLNSLERIPTPITVDTANPASINFVGQDAGFISGTELFYQQ